MAVTLLTDVPDGAGGFTIWPGSPQLLYPTSAEALNWMPTDASAAAMDRIKHTIEPLEFCGSAGDVVLTHGLMVHSAGIHRRKDVVRRAIIMDFNKVRPRGPLRWSGFDRSSVLHLPRATNDTKEQAGDDDPVEPKRPITVSWHHDGMEWNESAVPPFKNMWQEWNLGKEPVRGNVVSDEPSWWDKYELPLLPSDSAQRGGGGCPAVPLDSIADYQGQGKWRARNRGNDWLK
jgi:hypothetical protein